MILGDNKWWRKIQWWFAKKGGLQFQCMKCRKYMYGWPPHVQDGDDAGRIGRVNVGASLTMTCGHPGCGGTALTPGGSFLLRRVPIINGSLVIGETTEWRRIREGRYFRRGLKCGTCGADVNALKDWVEPCAVCAKSMVDDRAREREQWAQLKQNIKTDLIVICKKDHEILWENCSELGMELLTVKCSKYQCGEEVASVKAQHTFIEKGK